MNKSGPNIAYNILNNPAPIIIGKIGAIDPEIKSKTFPGIFLKSNGSLSRFSSIDFVFSIPLISQNSGYISETCCPIIIWNCSPENCAPIAPFTSFTASTFTFDLSLTLRRNLVIQ